MTKIKINTNLRLLPKVEFSKVNDFQGDLKNLNERNYEKLKKSLIEQGLLSPIALWNNNGKLFLIDGQQRKRVWLTENFQPAKVPYFIVPAKTKTEAKKKLLAYTSQYGRVTKKGYEKFSLEIPTEWKKQTIHFDALFSEFKPELKHKKNPIEGIENDYVTFKAIMSKDSRSFIKEIIQDVKKQNDFDSDENAILHIFDTFKDYDYGKHDS